MDKPVDLKLSEEELRFLRDEGLELLSLFRSVRNPEKRQVILDIVRMVSEAQSPTNGE